MSEQQRFPDSVLFQRVEQIYMPAQNWQLCTMPLTSDQLIEAINVALPGYFDNTEKIFQIFEELNFRYERNEFNNKYYWLVNPV
ncbi:hypothetical protein ACVWYN_002700 [Pedobacter sp. UYP24]